MRILYIRFSAYCLLLISLLSACNKKTVETFETDLVTDYAQLQIGKFITYRVDSLVFPNFGRGEELHKYQQKHVVDALLTDGLGRPAYRIYRYIRDSAGTEPWRPNGSYFVTPLADQLEIVEDNLRFIAMHLPIKEGYSWKGNKFLPDNAYDYFSNDNSYDDGMADWDFYYDRFESTVSYRGKTYTDVYTIEKMDESYNIPVVSNDSYGSRVRAYDQYSKNIGLVFREYTLYEYQPNIGLPGGPFKTGFGVTMWMIDHN